jgi:hypothetical protein
MSANDVQEGLVEIKGTIVNKAYCIVTINPSTSSGLSDFPYQATFQLSQQTWYKMSPNGATTQITNFADEVNYIFTMTHKAYGESSNGVISICEPYFNWAYSGYDSVITKFNGRLNPDYWKIIATTTGNVKVLFTIDYK